MPVFSGVMRTRVLVPGMMSARMPKSGTLEAVVDVARRELEDDGHALVQSDLVRRVGPLPCDDRDHL